MAEAKARGKGRVAVGVVTRDKMDKTRRVEIQRLEKHRRYGKYVKRRTVCYVHDERNESQMGDTVEIIESRPMSKLKTWRLMRVVTKAPGTHKKVEDEITTPETVAAPPASTEAEGSSSTEDESE